MSTRVDWRGRAIRRDGMPLEKALAMADEWKATRIARGGKAGEHHYDGHRALERLARTVRAARAAFRCKHGLSSADWRKRLASVLGVA